MECEAAAYGLDFWKGITMFLSATTLALAFQQYDVTRNKLKLDLFEKRFEVFSALRKFLSHASGTLRINEKDLDEYRVAILEVAFLFEQDLVDYLQGVWERGLAQKALEMTEAGRNDGETWAQNNRWFSQELKTITNRFSPYMAFGKWKDV